MHIAVVVEAVANGRIGACGGRPSVVVTIGILSIVAHGGGEANPIAEEAAVVAAQFLHPCTIRCHGSKTCESNVVGVDVYIHIGAG